MPIQARITYYLSEMGRRDSLRQGGSGFRVQEEIDFINEPDLEAFHVDEDGQVSFDLTTMHGCDPDFNPQIRPPASKGRYVSASGAIEWDIVPSWDDLLAVVRGFKNESDDMEASHLEERAVAHRIAQEFLDDPAARASFVGTDHAVIAGKRFNARDHPVFYDARKRWDHDQSELKKANRATLAEWVGRHGTENQRQRLNAGVLPWQEAYDTVAEYLYRPLADFLIYRRFEPEQVCLCIRAGSDLCNVKFQSVDATELTADEWDQLSNIQAAIPGATFQLREHRAQCVAAASPQVRRGVIVKFLLGQLGFKREFALDRKTP
jgi:hypothetical protein